MKQKRTAGAWTAWGCAPALLMLALLALSPSRLAGRDVYPGTIDVSEIKPGMKGYGLSVFQGSEPVRFEVEVIDVLPNALAKQDLIIVRCSGQNLEKSMIIAGMSGSPIYLEDRLAGALAYGWAFSQDPIAGITPIKNMISAANRPAGNVAAAGPKFLDSLAGRSLMPASEPSSPPSPRGPQMSAIATPVLASGFSPQGLALLSEELAPYNLIPVAGGGVGSDKLDKSAADAMVPGSAIGAALVTGDLSLAAIGTLTWRDGEKVAAFGHPFLQAGMISMPLVSANILTIVNLQDVSFKLGAPGAVIGELTADNQAAITGVIGRQPETVPMTVRVRRPATELDDTYNLGLARDPFLTPLLVRIALMEVIRSASPALDPTTVRARTRLKLSGYGEVEYSDVYAIMRNNFTMGLLDPVIFFSRNPFEDIHIESADVDLEVSEDLQVAAIESVYSDTDEVAPGGTVSVGVVLRPYGGEPVHYTFQVPVPDADLKTFVVKIGGGNNAMPDEAAPRDVKGMIRFMNAVYPGNDLVLMYQVPGSGVDVQGQRLHGLPPSVSSMLQPVNSTETEAAPEVRYLVRETPYVIVGMNRLAFKVKAGAGK